MGHVFWPTMTMFGQELVNVSCFFPSDSPDGDDHAIFRLVVGPG